MNQSWSELPFVPRLKPTPHQPPNRAAHQVRGFEYPCIPLHTVHSVSKIRNLTIQFPCTGGNHRLRRAFLIFSGGTQGAPMAATCWEKSPANSPRDGSSMTGVGPKTHRYRITAKGLRTAIFYTRLYNRSLRTGLAII